MAWAMLRGQSPAEDVPPDFGRMIRIGRVASVDLAQGTVTVAYGDPDDDDGEVESPPLIWGSSRAGSTRVWIPPSVGEQVVFLCPEGELGMAVPVASLWSDANPAPGNSARALILFDDGAELAYDPEAQHCDIKLPGGATLAIEADGGVTIKGDVTVTGTLTASTDVVGGGKSLKDHRHTGVQPGSGISGAPQ